jgi:HAD superfamily hydrolase (TIGR01549 family)
VPDLGGFESIVTRSSIRSQPSTRTVISPEQHALRECNAWDHARSVSKLDAGGEHTLATTMSLREPKVVLFDFGGTLDSDGIPWKQRFYPIYRAEGIEWDFETFAPLFHASDDSLTKETLSNVDYKATLLEQVERVLRAGNRFDALLARRISERFYQESLVCLARNKALLEKLSRRYRLGIVSNFYGNLQFLCQEIGYAELFVTVIDSARIGHAKPEVAIFKAALQQLDCLPEEAVFVGDNPLRDMAPAKTLAMPHIWLNTLHPERPACCENDVIIKSIADLSRILL